jgi:hypothetical protein
MDSAAVQRVVASESDVEAKHAGELGLEFATHCPRSQLYGTSDIGLFEVGWGVPCKRGCFLP